MYTPPVSPQKGQGLAFSTPGQQLKNPPSITRFPFPAATAADELLKLLMRLGICDERGLVCKRAVKNIPLPELPALRERLSAEWVKQRGFGFSWLNLLDEVAARAFKRPTQPVIHNVHREDRVWTVEPSQITLCGSSVFYFLHETDSIEPLMKALLGEHFDLLTEQHYRRFPSLPDDFDIRLKVVAPVTDPAVEGVTAAVKRVVNRQFVKKFFRREEKSDRLAAIGLGCEGEPDTEFIAWTTLQRVYLFSGDNLQIEFSDIVLHVDEPCQSTRLVSKGGSDAFWQAIIDHLAAVCHVEDPKSVNAMGWLKLISKRCKGQVLRVSAKEGREVERTLLDRSLALEGGFTKLYKKQRTADPYYNFTYAWNATVALAQHYPENSETYAATFFEELECFGLIDLGQQTFAEALEKMQVAALLLALSGAEEVTVRRDGTRNVLLWNWQGHVLQIPIAKNCTPEALEEIPDELQKLLLKCFSRSYEVSDRKTKEVLEKGREAASARITCESCSILQPLFMEWESPQWWQWVATHYDTLNASERELLGLREQGASLWAGALAALRGHEVTAGYAAVQKRFLACASTQQRLNYFLQNSRLSNTGKELVALLRELSKSDKTVQLAQALYNLGEKRALLTHFSQKVWEKLCTGTDEEKTLLLERLEKEGKWAQQKALIEKLLSWDAAKDIPLPLFSKWVGGRPAVVLLQYFHLLPVNMAEKMLFEKVAQDPIAAACALKETASRESVRLQVAGHMIDIYPAKKEKPLCKHIRELLRSANGALPFVELTLRLQFALLEQETKEEAARIEQLIQAIQWHPCATAWVAKRDAVSQECLETVLAASIHSASTEELALLLSKCSVADLRSEQLDAIAKRAHKNPALFPVAFWKEVFARSLLTAAQVRNVAVAGVKKSKELDNLFFAAIAPDCVEILHRLPELLLLALIKGGKEITPAIVLKKATIYASIQKDPVTAARFALEAKAVGVNFVRLAAVVVSQLVGQKFATPAHAAAFIQLEEAGAEISEAHYVAFGNALLNLEGNSKVAMQLYSWAMTKLRSDVIDAVLSLCFLYGVRHIEGALPTASFDAFDERPNLRRKFLEMLYSQQDLKGLLYAAVCRRTFMQRGMKPTLHCVEFAINLLGYEGLVPTSLKIAEEYFENVGTLTEKSEEVLCDYLQVLAWHKNKGCAALLMKLLPLLIPRLEALAELAFDLGNLVEYMCECGTYFPEEIEGKPFSFARFTWCERLIEYGIATDIEAARVGKALGYHALHYNPGVLSALLESALSGAHERAMILLKCAVSVVQKDTSEQRVKAFEPFFLESAAKIRPGTLSKDIYQTMFELHLDTASRILFKERDFVRFRELYTVFKQAFAFEGQEPDLLDLMCSRNTSLIALHASERSLEEYQEVCAELYRDCRDYLSTRIEQCSGVPVKEAVLSGAAALLSIKAESLGVESMPVPLLARECHQGLFNQLKSQGKTDIESCSIAALCALLAEEQELTIPKKHWEDFHASFRAYMGRDVSTVPLAALRGFQKLTLARLERCHGENDFPALVTSIGFWKDLAELARNAPFGKEITPLVWKVADCLRAQLSCYRVKNIGLGKKSIHDLGHDMFAAMLELASADKEFYRSNAFCDQVARIVSIVDRKGDPNPYVANAITYIYFRVQSAMGTTREVTARLFASKHLKKVAAAELASAIRESNLLDSSALSALPAVTDGKGKKKR